MEIQTLRYFLAVAREENMTHAAESLHVSQPTLSRRLRALEEELGKKLFNRQSFSISLTDAGNLLRSRAERLVEMADKIETEFFDLDDITGGTIYLGLAESWQIRYLAREIRSFKERYPNLNYHITSGDTEQVTEKLNKELLDFAVICEPPDTRKYDYLPFPEADKVVLIIPKDDNLAKKETIKAEDLIGLPLFASEQCWKYDIQPWAKEHYHSLTLEGTFRLSYNGSMFAKEGLGYLFTLGNLIDTSEESSLTARPLSPPVEVKQYLIWKKHQTFTPIAERFLQQIRTDWAVRPE